MKWGTAHLKIVRCLDYGLIKNKFNFSVQAQIISLWKKTPFVPGGSPWRKWTGTMATRKISNGCSSANKPKHFKFGLRGNENSSVLLLKDYQMEARTKNIAVAQIAALNTILSNIPNGTTLTIKNFNKLASHERGLSKAKMDGVNILNYVIKNIISRYLVWEKHLRY